MTKREENVSFRFASDIVETDLVWNYDTQNWDSIISLSNTNVEYNALTINCEPYDVFFTEKTLTHDGREYYDNETGV